MLRSARNLLLFYGAPDPILSIFADGTDGFYFDGSKTDRTFQTANAAIAASDDAGESIGYALESSKWSGRDYASQIALQPDLGTNTDFGTNDFTGWSTVGGATSSVAAGIATITGGGTTGGRYQDVTVTSGATVRVRYRARKVSGSSGTNVALFQGGAFTTQIYSTGITSSSFATYEFIAKATGSSVRVYVNVNAGDGVLEVDWVSVQEIPGNHGLQTTSGARPTRQAGGLYRFDGLDDNLLTTLNPAASFAMMFKGKITSASKVVMGSRATTDTRVLIGTDASGLLAGGVGADSTTTIKGGSDIRATIGVGALVFDASTVNLYWNGSSIYSGALNGSVNTTIPLRIGAFNDNGTGGSFADADIYYALAIKKALTSAQIQAITNLWGTT